MNASRAALLPALLALAAGQALAQTPWYRFQSVDPTAPWDNLRPLGINDLGQVVGTVTASSGAMRGYVWLPAAAYGLPAGFTVLSNSGFTDSTATGINNAGQVGGSTGPGTSVGRWDLALGGNPNPVTLKVGGYGMCITSTGVVCGYGATLSPGCDVAGLFVLGSATPVSNAACTNSYINGVNGGGLVVGDRYTGQQLAFFAAPPAYVGRAIPNFAGAGANHYVLARAVNDAGVVAGQIYSPARGMHVAYTFQDLNGDQVADPTTEYTILNSVGAGECGASAINNVGAVGGHQFATSRGMLWTGGNEYILDNCVAKPGAAATGYPLIREVMAMNSVGQILCRAYVAPGQSLRGVVLTPTCYANCDGSAVAPIVNVADFGCFLQRFAAGHPYANCDGSTAAPTLNIADFGCFLAKFAVGCP